MDFLRTPDGRFEQLPGFPFQPHYINVNGLRIHYVDEGEGEVILCLHGEPTWAYLYRKMIPRLAAKHRVIAMDFAGFGRSDKPTDFATYTFQFHRDILARFIEQLDLQSITAVVQDWGGLLGLTVATQLPDRFARLVIMNTGLPTGDEPPSEAFLRWREFAAKMGAKLPIGRIIKGGLAHPETLSPAELAAYEAPFPSADYKAGVAAFPLLVPTTPTDPGAAEMRAARLAFRQWQKPALTLFSDGDPITQGGDRFFRFLIRPARKQPQITIPDAGHFLQEEKGEEIAAYILEFIERTPS